MEPQETQTTKRSIAAKLSTIAQQCAYVQKDKQNDFHRYTYASAAAVLAKVNDALAEQKIGVTVLPRIESVVEVKNAKGNTERLVTVLVTLRLHDGDSGEVLETSGLGSGQDNGDKAVMKAQTAAIKYAWLLALNISTGDDPEEDERVDRESGAVQQQSPSRQGAQRAQAAPQQNSQQQARATTTTKRDWAKEIAAAKSRDELAKISQAVGAANLNGQRDAIMLALAQRWDKAFASIKDETSRKSLEGFFLSQVPEILRAEMDRVVAEARNERQPGQEG